MNPTVKVCIGELNSAMMKKVEEAIKISLGLMQIS